MKKLPLSMMILIASFAATAQAASANCAAPVFPSQSNSNEGVRRVEKQVAQFRKCQAERAGQQHEALSAHQNAGVQAGYAKWAAATRSHANGQLAGAATQASPERDQREHLAARLAPMRPVYGSEREQ